MLPISAAAYGQGWALVDWQFSATRPQWVFRAGNMEATRIQFDAYRRSLHMPQSVAQIQCFCWSANEFRLLEYRRVNGFSPSLSKTHYPQVFPDVVPVVSAASVREYRFAAGANWGGGTYQNNYPTASVELTQSNRFYGVFEVSTNTTTFGGFDPYGIRMDIEQPGTKSLVRVLVLGHHNHVWQTGSIP